jgi:hypothetical protein
MTGTDEKDLWIQISRETYLLLQELQRLLPLVQDQVETVGRVLEMVVNWHLRTTRESSVLRFVAPRDTSWKDYDRSLGLANLATVQEVAMRLRLNRLAYRELGLDEVGLGSEVAARLNRMVRLFIERELRARDGWTIVNLRDGDLEGGPCQ